MSRVKVIQGFNANDKYELMTVEELLPRLNPKTHYYEFLDTNDKSKLYFDFDKLQDTFDVEFPLTMEAYTDILQYITDAMDFLKPVYGEYAIAGYDMDTINKHKSIGFHVVFFETATTRDSIIKMFATKETQGGYYNDLAERHIFVDTQVYGKTQKFRLPLCGKSVEIGKKLRKTVDKCMKLLYSSNGDKSFHNFCITYEIDKCIYTEFGDNAIPGVQREGSIKIDTEDIKKTLRNFNIPDNSEITHDGKYYHIAYGDEHECIVCRRKHDSSGNQKYWLSDTHIGCFRSKDKLSIKKCHSKAPMPMPVQPIVDEIPNANPMFAMLDKIYYQYHFKDLNVITDIDMSRVLGLLMSEYCILERGEKENTIYAYNKRNGYWEANTRGNDLVVGKAINFIRDEYIPYRISKCAYELNSKKDDDLIKSLLVQRTHLGTTKWRKDLIRETYLNTTMTIPTPKIQWNRSGLGIFPFKNGVYDLRTKEFRLPHKDEYLTLHVGYDYKEKNTTHMEKIRKLYRSIFPDEEHAEFNIRLNALGLWDSPKQLFAIGVGSGGNGKGILTALRKAVFDKFHYTMNMSFFLSGKSVMVSKEGPTSALMGLRYKRYVDIDEAQTGKEFMLDAGAIKAITGGGFLAGREMYKSQVEFEPTALLNFSANFHPAINGDDGGMERRSIFIPHEVKFVDDPSTYNGRGRGQYDKHIVKKDDTVNDFSEDDILGAFHLFAESIDWNSKEFNQDMRKYLRVPTYYDQLKRDYMASMDGLPKFLSSYLHPTNNRDDIVKSSALFKQWKSNATGTKKYNKEEFINTLKANGYNVLCSSNTEYLRGYILKSPQSEIDEIELKVENSRWQGKDEL